MSADKPKKKTKQTYTKDNFEFGPVLGKGAYGEVILTTFKATGVKFATKIIQKALVIRENKVKTIKVEKEVLSRLNHPNIVKLFCTYQDEHNLYFVLEMASGGTLSSFIKDKPLPPDACRFYTAEIVLALEYLHEQHIIHRDLKPENVLLSKEMHVKVTDFGTAKVIGGKHVISDEQFAEQVGKQRSGTFCGTPVYVSPETLTGDTQTEGVDLWALGCMIYQFCTGKHLFFGESEYLIFQKIKSRNFSFPAEFPLDAKDLCNRLLQINPMDRIGMGEDGYMEIKKHPFFKGIDWNTLNEQTPPSIGALPRLLRKSSKASLQEFNIAVSPVKVPAASSFGFEQQQQQLQPNSPSSPSQVVSSSGGQINPAYVQWKRFLSKQEEIVYTALVIKRTKGIIVSVKRRQLILTNLPRFFYVDPVKMELKGSIPWSEDLKIVKKDDISFTISTPTRDYILEDLAGNAALWANAVEELKNKKKNNQ